MTLDTRSNLFQETMSSSHDQLEPVLVRAKKFLEANRTGLSWFDLELVLRESLENAMKHGNDMDPSKKIRLSLSIRGDRLKIRVEDEGDGFDWKKMKDSHFPPAEQDHGRGLVLIREYGWNCEWNSKGNILEITHPLN